ncbi:hypothetical protein IG631_09226 [Alternaria alternata]|nr:hypothetical protein IG631_09226 [Alternaria alternata]
MPKPKGLEPSTFGEQAQAENQRATIAPRLQVTWSSKYGAPRSAVFGALTHQHAPHATTNFKLLSIRCAARGRSQSGPGDMTVMYYNVAAPVVEEDHA